MKGKLDAQNIDITKNQNILTTAINKFRITQEDNNQNQLLNAIIKVIGLLLNFIAFSLEVLILVYAVDF